MIKFDQALKLVSSFGKTIYKHRHGILKTIGIGTGIGAVVYAVKKAPETVHAIEDEGMKKGEPLSPIETASIIVKKQYPAIALGGASIAAFTTVDISKSRVIREMKITNNNLTTENKGLIEQVSEMAVAYNTVNTVKDAMVKKVEEISGKETAAKTVEEAVEKVVVEKPKNEPHPINVEPPYVENPKRLQEWEKRYLETGDTDYKPQVYKMIFTGQLFMSCNAYIKRAANTFAYRIGDMSSKGFCTLNEWCDEAGCRQSKIGDDFVWRANSDHFGIKFVELNEDGVAIMGILFEQDPYYDKLGEYY